MKKAILFVLSPDEQPLLEALNYCSKNEIEPTIVVPTYSFEFVAPSPYSEVTVLYPMDILKLKDIDVAFHDSFQWVKDFSQIPIGDKVVAELKIADTSSPKMWAWTHLLPPHLFLHFRFVKLVKKALNQNSYDYYDVIGDHKAFPWKKVFLFQIISRSSLAPLVYNIKKQIHATTYWLKSILPDSLEKSANNTRSNSIYFYRTLLKLILFRTGLESSKNFIRSISRKTKTLKKLQKLDRLSDVAADPALGLQYIRNGFTDVWHDFRIFSIGSWGRINAKKKQSKIRVKTKGNGTSQTKKKHFLIYINPHSAPFYFRPATKTWEVCDEYTEGLLENLLSRCDSKKHHVHIFYSRSIDFSDAKPSYEKRYPELASEYDIRDFSSSLTRKDDHILYKIAHSLEKIYNCSQLKELYRYEGTQLSLFGLSPLLQSFFKAEKAYFRSKRMWDSILDQIKPDVVIGGRLEAMAYIVESANERKIRTLGVKLGIAEELIPSLLKFDGRGHFDSRGNSDKNILWGPREIDFVRSELPALNSDLKAIGRPRIDTFVNDSPFTDREFCRKQLNYGNLDQVVLFGATLTSRYGEFQFKKGGASFMGPAYYKATLGRFDSLCDQHPELRILIKPWGGDNITFIKDCVAALKNRDRFQLSTNKETGFHNIQYLKAADLIVSNVSCLFGESVATDTPVVNLAYPPIQYLYGSQRLESYGLISKTVKDVDEMEVALTGLLSNGDALQTLLDDSKQKIPSLFGEIDGKIAHRIIDEAFDLAINKQTFEQTGGEIARPPEI